MKLVEIQNAFEIKKLEGRLEMVNPITTLDPTKNQGCTINIVITLGLA